MTFIEFKCVFTYLFLYLSFLIVLLAGSWQLVGLQDLIYKEERSTAKTLKECQLK